MKKWLKATLFPGDYTMSQQQHSEEDPILLQRRLDELEHLLENRKRGAPRRRRIVSQIEALRKSLGIDTPRLAQS